MQLVGVVVSNQGLAGVEFEQEFFGGHDCGGDAKRHRGYYISDYYLTPSYNPFDDDPNEEDYKYAEELGPDLEEMLFGG